MFGRERYVQIKKVLVLACNICRFRAILRYGASVGRRYRGLFKHVRNRAGGFFVRGHGDVSPSSMLIGSGDFFVHWRYGLALSSGVL